MSTVAVGVMAALLNACSGGGEGDGDDEKDLPEIEGLRISLTDFRYGLQDVGSHTSQRFIVSNVGVDTYPINNISITGENP